MRTIHKAAQGNLLPYYWRNGSLHSHYGGGAPTVPTFSQAMDYSVVIIDGARVNVNKERQCRGFRFRDHALRIVSSWESLGLTCPYTAEDIFDGMVRCVTENLKHMKERGDVQDLYVRPKLFLSDPLIKPYAGTTTDTVIECFPLGAYLPGNGVAVTLADHARAHRYSGYHTKGCGKYPEYGMLRDSKGSDYADVLQLGLGKGAKLIFTEGTTNNIFFVLNGTLYTPGTDDFILHGMTRDTVIQLAKHLEIPIVEGEVPLSAILECDELFVTGTASFIIPVVRIGKFPMEVGPRTEKLMQLFADVRHGLVPEFSEWLTEFSV